MDLGYKIKNILFVITFLNVKINDEKTSMKEIEVINLKKIYNQGSSNEVKALNDVSFSLDKGEFVVILGSSGAGKSTLLNILGGLDNATSGIYSIHGENVTEFNENQMVDFRRKEIGFVFQFYNLMPNLTALENVELAASLNENSLDSKEVIKSVGLEKREGNFPSELSGGEQQRVAIARAIVKNPNLLLCDEPTGALDSKTGGSVLSLLNKVAKEYRKTVIIVTHNSKIAQCAEKVLHISDGKLTSMEINEHPIPPEQVQW